MESCPAQAVLPLVGLAADTITRDGYSYWYTTTITILRQSNRSAVD
ncbi:MAG: hypothetical protein ACQESR_03250 [Planctomycetota bacterium]